MTSSRPPPVRTTVHDLLVPVAIGLVAGLAAWTTRAAFDLVGGDIGPVRIAMLPPVAEGVALVVGAVLLCVVFARAVGRRAATRPSTGTDAGVDSVLPLLGTGVLVLPYVPWLPDLWPALTMLAGPAKYVIWALAILLAGRAAARHLASGRLPRPHPRLPMPFVVAGIAAASLAVCSTAAGRLMGTVFPGGDEPHYLVIAQSLWRDGDLRIENNHVRGDTLEYYPVRLAPHYLARGVDGEIYSVHPVGLPVLAAPVYAIGGYRGVVGLLVALAALVSTLAWWFAFRVSGSRRAATFAWAGCALSAPLVFNSFTVYPEMPAALMVMLGYGLASGLVSRSPGTWRWASTGLALAALPWLSTKYVLMAGALGLVALGRLWWPVPAAPPFGSLALPSVPARRRAWHTLALCLPPLVSLVAWFWFFWSIWGTPSPSAPYGASSGTEPRHLWSGGPGLFFDQEYGVLAVAPVLWLAVVGAVDMARREATRRTVAEIVFVLLALLSAVGAFHLWWGGSAAIGRPLVAALPLLAVPLAWRVQQTRDAPALHAAHTIVLAVGLANVLVLATQGNGLLLASGRDGTSQLFDWWSPWWSLAAIAPTFIVDPPAVALGYVAAWLVPACLAGAALSRIRPGQAFGRSGLTALVATAAAAAAITAIVPAALGRHMRPMARLEARASSPLLDDFSPSRRPLAIEYRPFERIAPADVPGRFRFDARADDARPPAPVAVLYDARWSLPAGRYEVQAAVSPGVRSPADGTLGLQLGRLGEPVERWRVAFDPQGQWSTTFELPIYVGSVGFRASTPLAGLQPTLVVRPLAVTDQHEARPHREVLQTAVYGDTWVLFHTEGTYPEADGFWTRARRKTSVTFASAGDAPPRIVLRAGGVATGVTLVVAGRPERLSLDAGESRELTLPPRPDRTWAVTIETDEAFVPAAFDPASTDVRQLGCWVEIGS